ncbi:hypothetical protein [Cytophaga aurantiaca]|uniref:hypothetical protein n=1 Tax=Cytophaga aurantiaca TaxID=29530 RepID=UPI0003689DA7|nr:hypothetical protein [Cytophaga aurantiaca]
MKLNPFLFLFIGAFLFMQYSCYYDKFDEIHPAAALINTCDTALADTYNGSINAIMQSNCVSCHTAATSSSINVVLDSYQGVKTSAANGSLIGTMTAQPGYRAMPPSTRVHQCEIDRIQRWIDAGMPE